MSDRFQRQIDSVLADRDIVEELRNRAHAGELRRANAINLDASALDASIEIMATGGQELPSTAAVPGDRGLGLGSDFAAEAIIVEFGRPSLIIQDGTFEVPESSVWAQHLALHRSAIERVIPRVGRVELLNHFSYDWVGTGWMVAENTIITNRHVAEVFTRSDPAGGFVFAENVLGQTIEPRIDFREEYRRAVSAEFAIEAVLHVEAPAAGNPDIAVLRVATDAALPEPLELSTEVLKRDDVVGVIGYPAFDTRNGLVEMRRYFGEVYDVKRFAPGRVQLNDAREHYFLADYTSLGGHSGSPVIRPETGAVVGLHFAGRFREANFAVNAEVIQDVLTGISVPVAPIPSLGTEDGEDAGPPFADGTNDPDHFEGRDGYQDEFLGTGPHEVALPDLGAWQNDVAPVKGSDEGMARYRHFSVMLSASRRLPLLTAVNIDGRSLRRIPRVRKWFLDGRFSREHQTGNELYRSNDLDRGHMVRRLDPVWGDLETARQANADTFHYTNAAPQHMDLNQENWVDLENRILDHADARDLKISVLTGPVFRDNDPEYRGVQLPRAFWKVVAMVADENDELAALGFILSHSHLLRDLERLRALEETVFNPGSLRVFQVPIREVSAISRLKFSALSAADVLTDSGAEETAAQPREIWSVEDLVMPKGADS